MARVALRTLFGTAYPEAAGIGRTFGDFFQDIRSEFQDFKMEKLLFSEPTFYKWGRKIMTCDAFLLVGAF